MSERTTPPFHTRRTAHACDTPLRVLRRRETIARFNVPSILSVADGADTEISEGELMAAVDLGSNSFHLVVARYEHGEPRVIDRLRDSVRLAAGLRPDGSLDESRRQRALECLARFGQRLRALPPHRVRAVATNTVRRMSSPALFLGTAEEALGNPIEVVSGREEARLIYLGVAHGVPDSPERRLVIDIGGGSTEFIIGQHFDALEKESLQMGCVASTMRFFEDGKDQRETLETGADGNRRRAATVRGGLSNHRLGRDDRLIGHHPLDRQRSCRKRTGAIPASRTPRWKNFAMH